MLATVIKIEAWDPVAGAAVTLRAASHDHPEVCHLGDETWWPAITQLPKLRYDLFSGAFDGVIDTPSSNLTLALEVFPTLPRLALADASLQLWTGELGAPWEDYELRFNGIVKEQPRIDDDLIAQLAFAVDDRWLDTPLLALYEGTSGLEGEDGQKGLPKPLAIGAPRYVPGELIDSIDTIVQLSAYGAIGGVTVAMEKLSRFAASIGDYASLAALKAAAIPPGAWGTCNANGLVRHGAPLEGQPSYILEGDIAGADGWARKPGEIIRRLAGMVETAGAISDPALDALDGARPFNLSLYQAEQLTARQLIQRIAASVNAVAGVSWLGELFAVSIEIGEPSLTLRTDGSALPIVGNVAQVPASAPFWRLALLAQRTWHKHALGDIAFSGRLTPRGRYKAEETYREGDIVDMPDGSQWLFVGHEPATGIAPGTDADRWFNMAAALSTDDIRYDGGAGPTLQEYKPDGPGATRGAPAGTLVADMMAEEIVARSVSALAETAEQREQLSALLTSYLQAMLLQETRDARQTALAYMDGEGLHIVQRRETEERIEGDTAIITTMSLIGAKSLDGSAFILDLDTVKVGPTETFGERLTEIDATFATQAGLITSNYTTLVTAISDEESARVTAINTLTATVGTLTSDTEAAIASVEDAIADETSARATAISSLTATVSTLSGTVSSNYSTLNTAISNEASARASANVALYAAIGTNTSSISTITTSLATLTSTESTHYTTLSSSIGGLTSSVTTLSSAVTTLQGRTTAFWETTVNAGSGATAFIAAKAETSPGSTTSNVAIGGREVHISNPVGGTWIKVLSVSAGEVNVYGKLTATDAVRTPNIVAGNVTQMESTLSGSATVSDGGWKNVLSSVWHTFTLDYAAEVLVLFSGRANYSGSSSLIVRMLLYDAAETYLGGVEGPSSGDGAYMPNPCFPAKWSLGAGTYHISPQFLADAGDVEMRSGSGVIVFWRYK